MDTGKTQIPMEVEGCKFFKNQAILKFKGYDNINDIEKYKNSSLWVTRENAIPLEENEFYIADIIDATVYTEDGEELGVLTEVMETGANDVYVVRMKNGKEVLLPAIPECILDVDVEAAKVVVHLMKGLMDET
jgi:16S rRNA processing protein RimM